MDSSWDYPKKGFCKINVHAVYYDVALCNGNHSGIGIVIRDDKGDIIVMVSGSIRGITERANELWSLLAALRLAYYEDRNKVQLESDNAEAFREWNDLRWWIDPNHESVIQQLQQRTKDPNFTLELNVITESQNQLARFLAIDGAHKRTRLVIYRRSFSRVGELWRLDMGLGPVDPRFDAVDENEYACGEVQHVDPLAGEDGDWLVADVGSRVQGAAL